MSYKIGGRETGFFGARPHPDLLPLGEGKAGARFCCCMGVPGQYSRWNLKWTADDSPSPGPSRYSRQATAEGEGRGEVEPRRILSLPWRFFAASCET